MSTSSRLLRDADRRWWSHHGDVSRPVCLSVRLSTSPFMLSVCCWAALVEEKNLIGWVKPQWEEPFRPVSQSEVQRSQSVASPLFLSPEEKFYFWIQFYQDERGSERTAKLFNETSELQFDRLKLEFIVESLVVIDSKISWSSTIKQQQIKTIN